MTFPSQMILQRTLPWHTVLYRNLLLVGKVSPFPQRFRSRFSTSQSMIPVRYFCAKEEKVLLKRGNTDCSPLTLEEIMNTSILRRHALTEVQVTPHALVQPDASFPLLSQGDHPTLGTPGWFIHPCG